MNDELDDPIEDIDIDTVLKEQRVKGADISKIDRTVFSPALHLNKMASKDLEVVDRRTLNSKTYRIGKNTYNSVHMRSNVHFVDKDGQMREVNLVIREKNGKYIMTNAAYKVVIFTDRVGYRLKMDDGTGFKIELVRVGGDQADFTNMTCKVEGNVMWWNNVSIGITMKLDLRPDRPEIYTIIDNETSPRKFKWKINYTKEYQFESFGEDANGDKIELVTTREDIDENTFTYLEEWTGKVVRIPNKKNRVKALFNDPVYPVIMDPTANLGINANADDGWEQLHFNWLPNSIYVGWTSTSVYDRPGIRFSSVAIAAGVTVTSATLTMKTYPNNAGTGGLSAKVWGHNADNPGAFSTSSYPSDITKTTNSTSVTFSRTAETDNNIDVTSQVTQILGRGGWASGNAMRFAVLTPTGSDLRNNYIQFYDYNNNPAKAPTLSIVYTSGGGGGGVTGKLLFVKQAVNRSGTY